MKGLSMAWLTRNALTAVLAIVALSCAAGLVAVSAQKGRSESTKVKALSEEKSKIEAEWGILKKKYSDLESDRNNVLAQTKILLQDKTNYMELQESYAQLQQANKVFSEQKDKLHKLNVELEDKLAFLKAEHGKLKDEARDLKDKNTVLSRKNNGLESSLREKVESSPQYKQTVLGLKTAQSENARLKTLNDQLEKALKTSQARIGKVENREDNYTKQIDDLKKKMDALKAENEQFKKTNSKLNEEVKLAPQKFKDMASQNKVMVKETAGMHYNLGVFYAGNKNYELARREFERSLVFDPNNPKTHYNLGYLYSEYLDQHDKAMAYFEKYLEMDPHSKESVQVRAYILERQAYGDKLTPLELPNPSPRLKK